MRQRERQCLGLWVLLVVLAPVAARGQVDPAVLEAEAARVAVVQSCVSSTVAVFSPGGQGGGSGVVISADGYALSNFHVTRVPQAMRCSVACPMASCTTP